MTYDPETLESTGTLEELISYSRSSLPTAIAVTRDGDYIIVGDCHEEGGKVHLQNIEEAAAIRSIDCISSPMGICVTEKGDVYICIFK